MYLLIKQGAFLRFFIRSLPKYFSFIWDGLKNLCVRLFKNNNDLYMGNKRSGTAKPAHLIFCPCSVENPIWCTAQHIFRASHMTAKTGPAHFLFSVLFILLFNSCYFFLWKFILLFRFFHKFKKSRISILIKFLRTFCNFETNAV